MNTFFKYLFKNVLLFSLISPAYSQGIQQTLKSDEIPQISPVLKAIERTFKLHHISVPSSVFKELATLHNAAITLFKDKKEQHPKLQKEFTQAIQEMHKAIQIPAGKTLSRGAFYKIQKAVQQFEEWFHTYIHEKQKHEIKKIHLLINDFCQLFLKNISPQEYKIPLRNAYDEFIYYSTKYSMAVNIGLATTLTGIGYGLYTHFKADNESPDVTPPSFRQHTPPPAKKSDTGSDKNIDTPPTPPSASPHPEQHSPNQSNNTDYLSSDYWSDDLSKINVESTTLNSSQKKTGRKELELLYKKFSKFKKAIAKAHSSIKDYFTDKEKAYAEIIVSFKTNSPTNIHKVTEHTKHIEKDLEIFKTFNEKLDLLQEKFSSFQKAIVQADSSIENYFKVMENSYVGIIKSFKMDKLEDADNLMTQIDRDINLFIALNTPATKLSAAIEEQRKAIQSKKPRSHSAPAILVRTNSRSTSQLSWPLLLQETHTMGLLQEAEQSPLLKQMQTSKNYTLFRTTKNYSCLDRLLLLKEINDTICKETIRKHSSPLKNEFSKENSELTLKASILYNIACDCFKYICLESSSNTLSSAAHSLISPIASKVSPSLSRFIPFKPTTPKDRLDEIGLVVVNNLLSLLRNNPIELMRIPSIVKENATMLKNLGVEGIE